MWISDRLEKRAEWKQTVQPSAVLNMCAVGALMQPTDGDEKCVLKACVCIRSLLANLVTYLCLKMLKYILIVCFK